MKRMQSNVNPVAVFLVSGYLLAVGTWLMMTKQIPSPGFIRIVRRLGRAPFSATLREIRPESGHCFLASLPDDLLSDQESASSLRLYEDGKEIGPAHSAHSEIRNSGAGRFSHWGRELYFSTSDNSDPRSNGRRYSVCEVRE